MHIMELKTRVWGDWVFFTGKEKGQCNKQLFLLILEGEKKTYGQTKRKETQKNITKVITINIFARNILFAVTSSVSQL